MNLRWLIVFAVAAINIEPLRANEPLCVFIGTYGRGPGQGIHRIDLDTATGKLTHRGLAAETDNPSFLALAPNRRTLYAVSEMTESGKRVGTVAAFEVHRDMSKLTALNHQPSGGNGPCHVAVSPKGTCIVVANYGSGSVKSILTNPNGSLQDLGSFHQHAGGTKVNLRRQDGPHAHCAVFDNNGRYVVVADLGCDKLFIYRVDPSGKLMANDPASVDTAKGAGPRHFAFHPNGQLGFCMNELDSTITSYRYEPVGLLKPIESKSMLPDDFKGSNTTAEVRVHPNGRFVYGSNRGHDSIAVFAIDPETGMLTPRGHTSTQGKTPRNFNIDPLGRFLLAANQDSGSVVAFRINPEDGSLTSTGSSVAITAPVCVLFVPR